MVPTLTDAKRHGRHRSSCCSTRVVVTVVLAVVALLLVQHTFSAKTMRAVRKALRSVVRAAGATILAPTVESVASRNLMAPLLASAAGIAAAGGVCIVDTEALAPPSVTGHPRLFPVTGGEHIDGLSQYGLETTLIRLLEDSPYLAQDDDAAALYVVPQYATLETHGCLYAVSPIPPRRLEDCAANVTRDYLMPIIRAVQAMPAYRRSNGSNFVWVFPWDLSWEMFPGVPAALSSNLFWGYTGPATNLVSVPVTARVTVALEDTERNSILGGHSAAHASALLADPAFRTNCATLPPHRYLASFAGTIYAFRGYSKGLRQDLLEAFPEARAAETRVIVLDRHVGAEEYRVLLRESLFCLSPQGWTPWSQRLYFAVAAGCIPVFFEMEGFNVQLPFPDIVDWRSISIVVPEGRAKDVAVILGAVPAADICRMRLALTRAVPFLLWSHSPDTVLLGALHGAWQAVRARALRATGSAQTGNVSSGARGLHIARAGADA